MEIRFDRNSTLHMYQSYLIFNYDILQLTLQIIFEYSNLFNEKFTIYETRKF